MRLVGQTVLHYRIVEKLGEGGMGEVYKAEDTKLRRTVALKFLSQRLTADEETKTRFLQEARAAAALDHPNICTVYEVGEIEGRPYLAMAYIEGKPLDERIRESPLSVSETVELAIQIGEGLRAAHEKGIVHRDIKSANIMVTPRGEAKIMDFGVAQRTTARSGARELVGTAAYMSPEQSIGEPVDERSDLWSLGVVLYEMLCRRLPFQGDYEAAVLYTVMHEDPPSPTCGDRPVPPALQEVIRRALQKDRNRRYQRAEEVLEDLRGFQQTGTKAGARSVTISGRLFQTALQPRRRAYWFGAVPLVLVAASLLWLGRRSADVAVNVGPGGETPRRPSIAVLPLKNLSSGSDRDFFAEGMTDALITNLGKIRALRTISRTSVMQYQGSSAPLAQIAAALGVDYVVEGSVLRDGEQVRVSAQLIDATADRHLWADQYDGTLQDVFALQSNVAMAIAREIRVKLTPQEEGRLIRPQTVDPSTYEAYLLGRYLSRRRTRENLEKALAQFQEVIAAAPDWGLGYAGLADTYILLANYGILPPTEVWPQAKQAVIRALQLDNSLAEAHSTLGLIKSFYEWDWKSAEDEFRKALELEEGGADERLRYAVYLSRLARHREAIEQAEQARQLDPLSLAVNNGVAVIYYMARQYDDAIQQLQGNLELSDTYYRTHWNLGRCHLEQARFDQALAALQRAEELSGRNPFMIASLAHGHARAGNDERARLLLNELRGLSASRYVSPASMAFVEIGLGEVDQAFGSLGKALLERSGSLVWLKVDPVFDALRSDRRFEGLLEQVGLQD